MANRVSQEVIEALVRQPGQARVSQEVIEVLESIPIVGNRVSQLVIEVLVAPPVPAVTVRRLLVIPPAGGFEFPPSPIRVTG